MSRRFLLIIVFVSSLCPAILRAQWMNDVLAWKSSRPYSAYIELGGIVGDLPETGTTFLFAPLLQTSDEMVFADLRGLYNDLDEVEGNWGLGYRTVIFDHAIFGAYAYYDMRYTEWNNRFHQATLGMELLRIQNEARWNIYIPNDNQETTVATAFINNNRLFLNQGYEAAYYGTDFEYGHLLYSNCCQNMEVRGFVGGYAFDRGEAGYESIIGPRTRVEMRLFDLPLLGNGSRLVVGGQYQYDGARDHQGMAYAGIRIALGQGPKLTGLRRRMVNPVVRDLDIITNTGAGVTECAKFDLPGGVTPSNIVTIDANTADPEGEFAAAGTDSLVIFQGDAGKILADSPFIFNGGQVALGGGSPIAVVGCNSGRRAIFYAPGMRPTIDGGAGIDAIQRVFQLDDNNAIIGLNVVGGRFGIIDLGSGSHQIVGNHVTGATLDGVSVLGTLTGNVTGNVLDGNGRHGFVAQNVNGNFLRNSFSGNGGRGAYILFDMTGNVTDNRFNGNTGDGMVIEGNLTGDLTNNTFTDNLQRGLVAASLTGEVADNSFDNNRQTGFATGNMTGDVLRNSFDRNGVGGLEMQSLTGNVRDNTFNNNDGIGVWLNNHIEIGSVFDGNQADGNGLDGFRFNDNNGTFSNNTANLNGGRGYNGQTNNGTATGNSGTGNSGGGNTYPN